MRIQHIQFCSAKQRVRRAECSVQGEEDKAGVERLAERDSHFTQGLIISESGKKTGTCLNKESQNCVEISCHTKGEIHTHTYIVLRRNIFYTGFLCEWSIK